MKYIAKPASVEAFKFSRASHIRAVEDFLGEGFTVTPRCINEGPALLISNNGCLLAGVYEGEWVVINKDNSLSFYSDKDFLDKYQMAEE